MPSDLLRAVVDEANLHLAWEHVRAKRSAAGLDGLSIERLETDPEPTLDRLRSELRRGRYRPWPLKRIHLPKASGGWRPIAIATVRDRIAQRAVLQQLVGRAEPVFNESSFAYRPGRGVRDAIAAIDTWRRAGYTEVLETDIDDCFDSLDHALLARRLETLVPEADVRRLIGRWLTNDVIDRGTRRPTRRGVAQGDILSPLLCNLYLDPLDDALDRSPAKLVRYADDLVVLTRTRHGAERSLCRVEALLAELELDLNRHKTRLTSFEEGFLFLGVEFIRGLAVPQHQLVTCGPDGLLRVRGEPRYELEPPRAPRPDPVTRRLGHALDVAAARAARRGRDLPPVAEAFRRALAETPATPAAPGVELL